MPPPNRIQILSPPRRLLVLRVTHDSHRSKLSHRQILHRSRLLAHQHNLRTLQTGGDAAPPLSHRSADLPRNRRHLLLRQQRRLLPPRPDRRHQQSRHRQRRNFPHRPSIQSSHDSIPDFTASPYSNSLLLFLSSLLHVALAFMPALLSSRPEARVFREPQWRDRGLINASWHKPMEEFPSP